MTASRPLRILLIEDEAANQALVRAILDRAGRRGLGAHVLHEAGSLAQARAILAAEPVDVVLLDIHLPDGSGLELARELREHPPAVAPRIVMLSGSIPFHEQHAALGADVDDVLPKPFGAAELVGVLRAIADAEPEG